MVETMTGWCPVCKSYTEREYTETDLIEGKAYCPMNESDDCRETRLQIA